MNHTVLSLRVRGDGTYEDGPPCALIAVLLLPDDDRAEEPISRSAFTISSSSSMSCNKSSERKAELGMPDISLRAAVSDLSARSSSSATCKEGGRHGVIFD